MRSAGKGNDVLYIRRLALSNWLRFQGEHEIELEQKVYAICAEHEDDPERVQTVVVRLMHVEKANRTTRICAQEEQASALFDLEWNETTMQLPKAHRVRTICCTWDQSLPTVERQFRCFRGGHGSKADAEAPVGSRRQQWQLRAKQLPMGNATGKFTQPTVQPHDHLSRRNSLLAGVVRTNGHGSIVAALPIEALGSKGRADAASQEAACCS